MAAVKVRELDEMLLSIITESDHPEVAAVEVVPTADRPDNHTRLVVEFVNGRTAVIMVREVRGQGIRHAPYELPKAVIA